MLLLDSVSSEVSYIVNPPLSLELTLRAAQNHLAVFCLKMALEGDLQCSLIITLSAGIFQAQVLVLFMLGQTSLVSSLVVTLITGILDSFMSSADMDLDVVRSGGLEPTEAAGIGLFVMN